MNAPRAASVPARRVLEKPSGLSLKKREIGSTEPGAVSEKRYREISKWMSRALEVGKAGSHSGVSHGATRPPCSAFPSLSRKVHPMRW